MHILTFDMEEWYYLYHNPYRYLVRQETGGSFSLERITRKIFRFLEEKNFKATFFWQGGEARRYPTLVRELKEHGHEIGIHPFPHLKIERMGRKVFKTNVEKAIKTLEDIAGEKVTSYRAPFFSLTRKSTWALEILKDLGIECDSSTVVGRRFGNRFLPPTPCLIKKDDRTLMKEFPVTSFPIFRFDFKYGGSGYFRITPYKILDRRLATAPYVMSYFHPRDFDLYIHKKIKGNLYLKVKYRVGAQRAFRNLNKLSESLSWTSLEQANSKINWDKAEIIEL